MGWLILLIMFIICYCVINAIAGIFNNHNNDIIEHHNNNYYLQINNNFYNTDNNKLIELEDEDFHYDD